MELKEKTKIIDEILEQQFGKPVLKNPQNPLDNLILTILSQNTNDKNRDHAYTRLREKFPAWEDVMNADVHEIETAIKPGGLGRQKSQNIKNVLVWIKESFGELNVDFLCEMDADESIKLFCSQKGIGIKTMAVVLCFSCGIDIFPVDTHVHRICRRLGLVPDNASAEKTFYIMKEFVPKGKSYSLHLNFLKLGRTICFARKPRCEDCSLRPYCTYFQDSISV